MENIRDLRLVEMTGIRISREGGDTCDDVCIYYTCTTMIWAVTGHTVEAVSFCLSYLTRFSERKFPSFLIFLSDFLSSNHPIEKSKRKKYRRLDLEEHRSPFFFFSILKSWDAEKRKRKRSTVARGNTRQREEVWGMAKELQNHVALSCLTWQVGSDSFL